MKIKIFEIRQKRVFRILTSAANMIRHRYCLTVKSLHDFVFKIDILFIKMYKTN